MRCLLETTKTHDTFYVGVAFPDVFATASPLSVCSDHFTAGNKLPHGLLQPGRSCAVCLRFGVQEEKKRVTCAVGTLTGIEMGKSKTTKFKRPQFNTVGLPVNAVKEADEEEDDHGDESPAAELLEKV